MPAKRTSTDGRLPVYKKIKPGAVSQISSAPKLQDSQQSRSPVDVAIEAESKVVGEFSFVERGPGNGLHISKDCFNRGSLSVDGKCKSNALRCGHKHYKEQTRTHPHIYAIQGTDTHLCLHLSTN